MPAKSLLELASEACVANLRHLFDVGDCPYHLVRPILVKIENPDQLEKIEHNCPQIKGADADLWQGYIKRDIPNWEAKIKQPKNPKNWSKVYRKLKAEADESSARAEAALKEQLNALSAQKKSQEITFDKTLTIPKSKRKQDPATKPVTLGRTKVEKMSGRQVIAKARKDAANARRAFEHAPGSRTTPDNVQYTRIRQVRVQPKPSSFFTTMGIKR